MHLTEAIAFSGPHERRRAPASFDDAGESAEEAYRWLISEFAPPAVQVTESLDLVHVFGDCSTYLALPSGRASLRVLDLLAEPLAGAVGTAIYQATQQRKEIRYGGVRVSTAGAEQVVPVPGRRRQRSTYLVVFQPLDAPHLLAPGKDDLGDAMEARLVDLQEELHSVNEELHTVNTEYQSEIQELSELNTDDLDNLLRGSNSGTLFLDEHLIIRRFTPAVSELISVIPRDVGRSIEHFTLNFELPGFVELLRHTLDSSSPSSPPKRRATAPAWGCRWCTASSSRAPARCACPARWARDRPSSSTCPGRRAR
jgi:two-component system CheB/CheR fusion protein